MIGLFIITLGLILCYPFYVLQLKLNNLKCPRCKQSLYNTYFHFDINPYIIWYSGLCTKCKRKINVDKRGKEIL